LIHVIVIKFYSFDPSSTELRETEIVKYHYHYLKFQTNFSQ